MDIDAATGFIEGTYMDRSLADFIRGCRRRIEEEQRHSLPDTTLICLLADGIRCARELARQATLP